MAGGPAPSNQQSGSGIFGGAAGAPPTDTVRGLPMAVGFGTGGPGMGPPPEMVQQQAPQQISPVVQQMMMRQQQPMFNPQMQRLQGLQQLYSMFSNPQMRMPMQMQMPMYRSPALSYRPNIQQAQQNLSRVKPSVYKSDLDAARSRIAELEAQQQQQQNDINYSLTYGHQG